MALVVNVLGYEAIYDAAISAPDSNGMVTISGNIYTTNPNLEQANTAAAYSGDIPVDFPPIAVPISINVNQSRIQETANY
jgi:hypothetical protein